jgi:hypothetical protein
MSQLAESSAAAAPRAQGPISRTVTDFAPLVALGVLLVSSDPRFTFLDGEAAALNRAVLPMQTVLAGFRTHPPLYDLLLHSWLTLTNGTPVLLRIPSMVFYLAGIWLLSRAALRMGGEQSGTSLIWLVALGPFGFHYARLLNGNALSFLFIAALTWAYLRHAAAPSMEAWALVCAMAVLLVWTDSFGWIVLALLALEELIRNRDGLSAAIGRLATAAGVVLVTTIPLWRTIEGEARDVVASHLTARAAIFSAGYDLYVLGVSESVAPWYWKYGVLAMIAVAAILVLTFMVIRGQPRRFLIYGILLLLVLAVIRPLSAESLLLAAPWFFVPLAVVIGTTHASLWRRLMAASLAVAAGLGWYGVVARTYYATPRFFEPWGELAVAAGMAVRDGGAVIGNDPSFFLYLTYALRVPNATPWHFSGSLPSVVRYPQVWGPDDWQAASRPVRPTVLFIAGLPESGSMDQAADWLDHNCGDRTEQHLVRDPGFAFKERFLHEEAAPPWLVEFRQYTCGGNQGSPPAPTQ